MELVKLVLLVGFLVVLCPIIGAQPSVAPVKVVSVTLTISEPVVQIPEMYFEDAAHNQYPVLLTGELPGETFLGTLTIPATIQDGTGEFVLLPGTLVDRAGLTGDTITKGKEYFAFVSPVAEISTGSVVLEFKTRILLKE